MRVVDRENILIADSPRLFAHHVVELLQNVRIGEVIRQNARKLVQDEYGWTKIAAHLASLYEAT
jgi:glycosyltransferase involved in cell wall biosynthesis